MIAGFRQICLENPSNDKKGGRCLIVGEVAQTHDGSLGQAMAFIDAIANAGADAVKFQTHIAAAESTPDEPWRVQFSQQDRTRYEYWQRMEFTSGQWALLKEHAESRGLLFLSSPFSIEAVDLLENIGMSVWKIASGEVNNFQLLERIVDTGKPIILSSGMSDWKELDEAVDLVKKNGNPLAVLQCTTSYPCPADKIGLNLLDVIRTRYECHVGLSDHSGKIYAGLAAAALGAEVLEVHVTLSREMFGPDVPSSLTAVELQQLVEGVRFIEEIMGNPIQKESMADELEPLRKIFTKSIYCSSFLPAGTILGAEHLRLKKPGRGLPATLLPEVIGKRLRRSLQADELLLLEDIGE